MTLFRETADVSVRPAVAGDDEAMARVQVAAWRHAGILGDGVIDALDTGKMQERWAASLQSTPGPGFALFVALDGPRIVGFAAVAPSQILSLEVEPAFQRAGHGSRLLSAAVDRLRTDGAEQVKTWVLEGDTAREDFYGSAGLGFDGTVRTLATGVREVTERRWSAQL
ncbi:GNAT family N-acetyltransferase [Antribacter gilvus]|uniref:GNAT family N-acetyltransferase n=1 Tax=Antribacter gilvus TaxID=2304675 RepID=UPI000F7A5D7A|nr:GNAT family N-acetyltransferase [Antribacter gilvus]